MVDACFGLLPTASATDWSTMITADSKLSTRLACLWLAIATELRVLGNMSLRRHCYCSRGDSPGYCGLCKSALDAHWTLNGISKTECSMPATEFGSKRNTRPTRISMSQSVLEMMRNRKTMENSAKILRARRVAISRVVRNCDDSNCAVSFRDTRDKLPRTRITQAL